MALLTRFIKLNDEEDSHVFTFLVTKSVTKSTINRDVISKDFTYGFHRWAVSFSKENKVSYINVNIYFKFQPIEKFDFKITLL